MTLKHTIVIFALSFQCLVSWGEGLNPNIHTDGISLGNNSIPGEGINASTLTPSDGWGNFSDVAVSPAQAAAEAAVTSKLATFQTATQAAAASINALVSVPVTGIASIPITQAESCATAASLASKACLTSLNPGIQTALATIGVLAGAATTMKNMSESCSKMNEALKVGQLALTAFNTLCSGLQAACALTCGTVTKTLATAQTQLKTACPAGTPGCLASQISAQTALTSLGTAVTGPASSPILVCEGFKLNLAAAVAGLAGAFQQYKRMKSCESALAVVDCVKTPGDAKCPQIMDCTKTANAKDATCICRANPNAPGCPNATVSNAIVPIAPKAAAAPTSNLDAGEFKPNGGSEVFVFSPTGRGGGGAGSGGGGSGSGGGSGAAGGAGSGAAKDAKTDAKKGLNGNILGGFDGGGGGGSGGSRSGGSGNSALQAFLPGGKKDPNRSLASQTFGKGEVTAAGSKSNWEKVKDRYLENKPSLLAP